MNKKLNRLYFFNELSEKAKTKALKTLQKHFINAGDMVLDTETLRNDIENVWFYEDGTVA